VPEAREVRGTAPNASSLGAREELPSDLPSPGPKSKNFQEKQDSLVYEKLADRAK